MSHQSESRANPAPSGRASHDFNVNFFKPQTEHSRADMKMIVVMVLVWAVAVFGFQFLLCALNEPTPEESYVAFQKVWPNVQNGSASVSERQEYAKIALSVLGKNIAVKSVPKDDPKYSLKNDHKGILQNELLQTVVALLPDDQKDTFRANLADAAKIQDAAAQAARAIGLQSTGFDKLRADLLPSSLATATSQQLSDEIPGLMELYLVHNQSFLTDFRFMGFPFHYWYTAQFLLILFVLLCLIYAYATDKLNEKYDFADE